jgi:tetratricopeptide (TPR) repeat protein
MPEKRFTPRALPFLLSLSLFLFAFLLYQNTVPNDYAFDDSLYCTHNKFVQQGLKGIPAIFTKSLYYGFNGKNDQIYRPFPVASLAVQHSLVGNNPHFSHFVNVLLYALCCGLLMLLLCRLMAGASPVIPFCITLLFTAHPVHAEAVANIKGLDEILAFFFFVLTLHFLLCHVDRKRPVLVAASVLSFFLCLLCKEHGLTLLGILPLTLFTFRPLPGKKIVLLMLPYGIAAALYILCRTTALDNFTFQEPLLVIQNTLMAADNPSDRLATAFVILGRYLKLLFVPWPLCWDYSYNQIPITTWADPQAFLSFVIYAVMLAAGTAGALKKNRLAFAALFFLLSFSLSSNLFVKIGVTLGERLLFTPSLGFCTAAVLVFLKLTARVRYRKPLAAAVITAVVSLYTAAVVNRNEDWKDDFTVISRDIVKNPGSATAHKYLADQLMYKSKLEKDPQKKSELFSKGLTEYHTCVAIFPGYTSAWYQLGYAYREAELHGSAITAYRKILELEPRNSAAANLVGTLYVTLGRFDSAAFFFKNAISINPDYVAANMNLGEVDFARKNYAASFISYKKALACDPVNKKARDRISRLSLLLKDTAGKNSAPSK